MRSPFPDLSLPAQEISKAYNGAILSAWGLLVQKRPIHKCKCPECRRRSSNPTKDLHHQMNFLVSTLDEHQQRLYLGLEAKRLGHGGDRQIALVTGLSVDTIAKGRQELQQAKANEHIRRPGGGRPRVEKKTRRS